MTTNSPSNMRIEDMSTDDRPREKALSHGVETLSNAELIAVIFGNGIRGKSVVAMSQELLQRHDNLLHNLSRKTIKQIIKENPGIGPAKAISLAAVFELGKRCQDEDVPERPSITSSRDAYAIMRTRLSTLTHEEFWILLVSQSGKLIDKVRISQGGSAATVVDPKMLFKRALESPQTVASIILVHNHPSGTCHPSEPDDSITRHLKDGGKLLDIRIIDHIIITPTGFYSYADEGRL